VTYRIVLYVGIWGRVKHVNQGFCYIYMVNKEITLLASNTRKLVFNYKKSIANSQKVSFIFYNRDDHFSSYVLSYIVPFIYFSLVIICPT